MNISIIAAVAENGIIGKNNRLPWHLSDDLKNFRRLTMGNVVIMGRKTYESIGRPLKGRTNIVLSRNLFYPSAGIHVAESIEKAVQLAGQGDRSEAFIIGGAEIYRLAIPLADRIYLTRVSATLVGDARFPEFNEGEWDVLSSKAFLQSPENEFPFRIIEMIRKNK